MGLEIVEFIMEVEDEFGIDTPDDVAGIRTVGDFVNYVWAQLDGKSRDQKAITAELRGLFAKALKLDSHQISTEAPLLTWISTPSKRRKFWSELRHHRSRIPALRFPPWARWALWSAALLTGLASGVGMWWICRHSHGVPPGILTGFLVSAVLFVSVCLLENKYGACLPGKVRTIADLAGILAAKGPAKGGTWTREEVEARILELLSKCTAVPKAKITLDKEFVRDLGMD